jgi:hypothetical protein
LLLSATGVLPRMTMPLPHLPLPAGSFCSSCYAWRERMFISRLELQTIAQKTNTENPWLAWIPMLNIILMLNIAKKPIWWFVLFLIPLVGIAMMVIVWEGCRRGAQQAQLVGHPDDRSGSLT